MTLVIGALAPFFLAPEAEAAASSPSKWVRYQNNPVLSKGGSGAWDSDGTWMYTNCVVYNGTGFMMYYAGYDGSHQKIGLATSSDGKSWTKYASNPILSLGSSGSWDSTHVGQAYVTKDGSNYKMWFNGHDGTRWRLGYATSSDGISWTKYSGNPILSIGANGAWDDYHVGNAAVLEDSDGYRLWFMGDDGTNERIGYATSTDGINWTKYASNPVLGLGANNEWDDYMVSTSCVLNMSGTYRMWFSGNSGANWGVGYATSSDGKSWTKSSANPVLARQGNGFEAHDAFVPAVIHNGTTYLMWYTGVDSSWNMKFGYAEGWNTVPDAPAPSAPGDNTWTTNNKPTFTWTFSDTNSQDKQTAFQVQLDDKSDFSSVDHDSAKVSSATASYTPGSAVADGTYYWRARVWDSDDDSGSWSTTRTIKIDATAPANPSTFASTSHTIAQWSTDNTIDISWSGASDGGSGLNGYSYTWDYATSTLPDTTRDIDSTVSARTSAAVSDSKTVYFHIRAMDVAGNIAAEAAHYGPFWVDATPPSNPSVVSGTHTLSKWTNLTVVNVSWSGADGSISGVNGYSTVWDTGAGTLPDTVKEYNATDNSSQSPGLPDGIWYFHIRTKDESGNWASAAAHFGPLLIDATPPFNPLTLTSDHGVGVWSRDDTVDVQWKDFNGSLSGIEGFSYSWDGSPDSLPDETKDCDKDVSISTSAPLSDGSSYYFHIRARDNAGNWNGTASHIGPFWIDITPPANPVAITSGSHRIMTWSNDTTIDVSWSTADGGGRISGYEGYSFVWDISPTTIPDMTQDVDANATSTASPPMPDSGGIYFHIRAKDRAGNWAADAAHLGPFYIDSTPPKNPSVVDSSSHRPETWSADNTVDMNWSAADGNLSGIDGYSFLWDRAPGTLPAENVNVTAGILGSTSLPLPDGHDWYFHIRTKDTAGNWAPGAVHRGPYLIDTAPPVIFNFSINSGAPYTTGPTVRLSVNSSDPAPGSGLYQRRHLEDDGNWSSWEDFTSAWNITLAGGDGQRTVRVQLRDRVENAGPESSATILLDTHAPSGIGIRINSGVNWTNAPAVVLSISAEDAEPGSGLFEMALGRDGTTFDPWEPFSASRAYNLTAGDGAKTVFLKVKDRAGNAGSTASDDILLDTVSPGSLALTIAGGAAYTTNATVALTPQAIDPEPASGVGEMAFSEDGTAWTEWMPYSGVASFTFSPGDGTRTLHFRVRDRAMNPAGPASDTILLDTTAPSIGLVQVAGVSQTIAVVTWYTDEPSNGLVEYGSTIAYGSKLADAAYSTQHSLTINGLAASTEYHLRVSGRDVFGNGPSYGADVVFRTLKGEDRKAPVVSNVRVTGVTDKTALVSWDTDEPADSAVEYGATKELGQRAANSSWVQSHSVLLRGLSATTTYYLKARSSDPSGNGPGSSELIKFTTPASPDTAPPAISGVTVTGITDVLAVVSWTTDEPAGSRLESGLGTNYSRVLTSDRLEVSHVVLLTGLLPGKEYHFRVGGSDASGNGPSFSADMTFTTATVRDSTPPAIQQTRLISSGKDNVTLEVVLSEPGTVLIDFGTSAAYGKTAASSQFRTTHQLTLPGLAPGTTYHYRVSATDATGNGPVLGADQSVRTKNAPVTTQGFGLSTETAPYLFLVIVAIAALATFVAYRMTRKPGPGAPPPVSPPMEKAPETEETLEMEKPGKMEVVSKVSAGDLEDEEAP